MGTQNTGKAGRSLAAVRSLCLFRNDNPSRVLDLPLDLLPPLFRHEVVGTPNTGDVEGHKDGQNVCPEEGCHGGENREGCLSRAADIVTRHNSTRGV